MELTRILCPTCGSPTPVSKETTGIAITCKCQTYMELQEVSGSYERTLIFGSIKQEGPKEFLIKYLGRLLDDFEDAPLEEQGSYKKVLDWERDNSIPYWIFQTDKIKDALMEILRENSIVVLTSKLNAFLQNLMVDDSDLYKEEEELCGDCCYKMEHCVCPDVEVEGGDDDYDEEEEDYDDDECDCRSCRPDLYE